MKCPHCLVQFHDREKLTFLGGDVEAWWSVASSTCPNCEKLIFQLAKVDVDPNFVGLVMSNPRDHILIRPRASSRSPVPPQVPERFAEDYREACLVLVDSPKASAALSRRCLQNILREIAEVKHGKLLNEIQEVINGNSLPSDIVDSIDLIRNIGNFAAHPTKNQSTGEILPVETGEAEWCLDVIEMLFEFYFVRPENNRAKLASINQKLADAGKHVVT